MEKLEEFCSKQKYLKYVNEGWSGQVFQLTENHVGKFLLDVCKKTLDKLQKENKICKIAYEGGMSVPKPEGIFNVMHPTKKNICPAFVMEYLHGKLLKEIFDKEGRSKLYFKIQGLATQEIKKAENLKLLPRDWNHSGNIIWDSEIKKVYLIDFEYWEIKK